MYSRGDARPVGVDRRASLQRGIGAVCSAVGRAVIAGHDHRPLRAELAQEIVQRSVESSDVSPVALRRNAVGVTLVIRCHEVGYEEVRSFLMQPAHVAEGLRIEVHVDGHAFGIDQTSIELVRVHLRPGWIAHAHQTQAGVFGVLEPGRIRRPAGLDVAQDLLELAALPGAVGHDGAGRHRDPPAPDLGAAVLAHGARKPGHLRGIGRDVVTQTVDDHEQHVSGQRRSRGCRDRKASRWRRRNHRFEDRSSRH